MSRDDIENLQAPMMKSRILTRPRPWDKYTKKRNHYRQKLCKDDSLNSTQLYPLPVVTSICGCSIDAGQLFALGEVLYVLRPAVYATLRVRSFPRRQHIGDHSHDDDISGNHPLRTGKKDDKKLLFALVVSLVRASQS